MQLNDDGFWIRYARTNLKLKPLCIQIDRFQSNTFLKQEGINYNWRLYIYFQFFDISIKTEKHWSNILELVKILCDIAYH